MSEFQAMTGPRPVKLTIGNLELLQESGALDRYRRVELVEGVIVEMNSEWSRHARAKNEICYRLRDALNARKLPFTSLCDVMIKLSDHSCPVPDGVVMDDVPGSKDYIPGSSIKIVIEVADSSRESALGYKYELYGGHGLAEYWVVDLRDERIHIFWGPKINGYKHSETSALGSELESRTILGLSIDTLNLY